MRMLYRKRFSNFFPLKLEDILLITGILSKAQYFISINGIELKDDKSNNHVLSVILNQKSTKLKNENYLLSDHIINKAVTLPL